MDMGDVNNPRSFLIASDFVILTFKDSFFKFINQLLLNVN